MEKLIRRTAIVVGALVLFGIANPALAQWNTNVLNWDAPTTCQSGQPIANCPVTSYRVERAPSATGTFAVVGTSTSLTYTHLSAAAGVNCYRVFALSATGESFPSSVACKTNVEPAGPPNPPTNLRVAATTAYNVRPDYQHFTFVRSTYAGRVQLGAACDESRTVGNGYYAIERPRSQVTPRPAEGVVLVAKCA